MVSLNPVLFCFITQKIATPCLGTWTNYDWSIALSFKVISDPQGLTLHNNHKFNTYFKCIIFSSISENFSNIHEPIGEDSHQKDVLNSNWKQW